LPKSIRKRQTKGSRDTVIWIVNKYNGKRMLSRDYITVKSVNRLLVTPGLSVPHLFDIKIRLQRKVYLTLQSACANSLITLIGHNSEPSLSYIEGCHSINKQFSIDPLLDCESHCRVFDFPLTKYGSSLKTTDHTLNSKRKCHLNAKDH